MTEDIKLFIASLSRDYYECLVSYIAIPNHPNIAPEMYSLLTKYGNKITFISEAIEEIRRKHKTTYNHIQILIRRNCK